MKRIIQMEIQRLVRSFVNVFCLSILSLSIFAQDVNIVDANFLAHLIDSGFDTNQDGIIQVSEALDIVEINNSSAEGVISLEGIEAFENLKQIRWVTHDLITVNLSQNLNLEAVTFRTGPLEQIDLSNLVKMTYVDLRINELSSIDVNHMTELQYLNLTNNPMTTLNLGAFDNLRTFEMRFNSLTEFNLSDCPDLREIDLDKGFIETVVLSNLPKLEKLYLDRNPINQFDMSNNMSALEILTMSETDLTSIDLSNQINLLTLELNTNNSQLTDLDLSSQNLLTRLSIGNIPWTTIENILFHPDAALSTFILSADGDHPLGQFDFTPDSYKSLEILEISYPIEIEWDFTPLSQLTQLEYWGPLNVLDLNSNSKLDQLVFTGNVLEELNINNGSIESVVELENLFQNILKSVCCDIGQIDQLTSLVDAEGYDCPVLSYCGFSDFENKSSLSGEFLFSQSLQDCTLSTNGIVNNRQKLKILTNNIFTTYITQPTGEYKLGVHPNLYNLRPVVSNNYFNALPSTIDIEVIDNSSDIIQDFNLEKIGDFQDVSVSLMPRYQSKPGFENYYILEISNNGSICTSGNIEILFDGDVTELSYTSPLAAQETNGKVVFDYEIAPFEKLTFELGFEHNSPMDTPPLNGGEVLEFTVTDSNASNDETPEDNVFKLSDEVVNAFDPNDITCLEGRGIAKAKVGDFVHYLVRFENTGTANATNVVVQNSVDLEKFDYQSLEILNSSHIATARLLEGGSAEFIFAGIDLPFDDEINDGFVLYRIRTIQTLDIGDEFSSQAQIYFDFNFPIVTNNYTTEVLGSSSTNDGEAIGDTRIYPNPAADVIFIEHVERDIKAIQVFDLKGQSIKRETYSNSIDMSNVEGGIYIVTIEDYEGNRSSVRLVLLDK